MCLILLQGNEKCVYCSLIKNQEPQPKLTQEIVPFLLQYTTAQNRVAAGMEMLTMLSLAPCDITA